MNARERFLETLLFGKPDKIPFQPGHGRESTLKAWHKQGLAEGKDPYQALLEILGIKMEPTKPVVSLGVSFEMSPKFEEKVLEHKDGHYIVSDWMGAITEISDEFDYTYIRSAKDFVTRKWHKFPVESEKDWEEMKKRFNPDTPGRFPEDFKERCKKLKDRDYPYTVSFNGPFWQLREFCGFENLCMYMIEKPDLVQDMVDFWSDFVSTIMEKILNETDIDRVHFSEDMAYKEHSMISPTMTRKYLLPVWKRWCKEIKGKKCPVIDVDSDGFVEELIPLWIEAGINVCDPMEVAAGNDIVKYREIFGNKMAYTGGIDKRAMAKGGKIIEKELLRVVPPLLKIGGFIPSCDHGVPPDISWDAFIHYGRILAQLTGWL